MTPGEIRFRVRRATKMVVLTIPAEREPEVFLVCPDVFDIVGKMLAVNQVPSSFGNGPRFEYEDVRFLLTLLGAPYVIAKQDELRPVDLWISAE